MRRLSPEADEAASALAARIQPVLIETFVRISGLTVTYDKGQWEVVLAALTDKLPAMLDSLPLNRKERIEMLGIIDFVDRSTRTRGHDEVAATLLRALMALSALFASFRRLMKVRVSGPDGSDVTDEVFHAGGL